MPIYFDENKIPVQFSGSANAVLGQLLLSVKTKNLSQAQALLIISCLLARQFGCLNL